MFVGESIIHSLKMCQCISNRDGSLHGEEEMYKRRKSRLINSLYHYLPFFSRVKIVKAGLLQSQRDSIPSTHFVSGRSLINRIPAEVYTCRGKPLSRTWAQVQIYGFHSVQATGDADLGVVKRLLQQPWKP
jgi:hypothetical protein